MYGVVEAIKCTEGGGTPEKLLYIGRVCFSWKEMAQPFRYFVEIENSGDCGANNFSTLDYREK